MTGMINKDGLEYDTDAWREDRNRRLFRWVGDPNAVAFILQFSDATELFDDLIDKDKPIEDEHVIRVLFSLLTEMPMNPFFDKNKGAIVPVIVTGINAWLDANVLERGTRENKVYSYVLRGWYCELILFVIYLTKGKHHMRSVSMEVREYFTHHETLEDYIEGLAK